MDYIAEQLDRFVADLALRLPCLLIVILLDHHMHIVIEEWHNKRESLEGEQPFSRIPRSLRDILPLPLTGQQGASGRRGASCVVVETAVGVFKGDALENERQYVAVKDPQLIEMVPFFVHPGFQSDQGTRQLCRCVHFLRISPAFVMGDIVLPYPMHLGERLIADQLPIIGADD